MVSVYRGIGPEKIRVPEDLLERTQRFGPFCRKPLSDMGEKPETALVLTIEIDLGVSALFRGYQDLAVPDEVFLKAATFSGSFFTCDFRAIFTEAPKCRFT